MKKRGIFSECFVENVRICKKLTNFMLSKVFVNIKTVLQNHYTVSVLTKLFLLSIYAFSELMPYY